MLVAHTLSPTIDHSQQSTLMDEEVKEQKKEKSQMSTAKLIGERFSVESDILASSH